MKQRILFLIASLLLTVAGVQTAFAQKVKINLAEGKALIYRVSRIESIEFLDPEEMGEHECSPLPAFCPPSLALPNRSAANGRLPKGGGV